MSKLAWCRLRQRRDSLLKETDFTQLADAPFVTTEKKLYREYRKFLRDIPLSFDKKSILKAKIPDFETWLEKKREGRYK